MSCSRLVLIGWACGCLIAAGVRGEITADNFSAYLTLTTDYVFRGISQSDEGPAVQGGVDFEHGIGLFAGIWASSVDQPSSIPGGEPRTLELDYYLGYRRGLGAGWSAALSVIRYTFPGADPAIDYDYTELALAAYYSDWLSLSVSHSEEVLGHDAAATSYDLSARRLLTGRLEAIAGIGHYDLDELLGLSYEYWNLGLAWTVDRYTFDLGYYDASSGAESVFGALAEGRVVLTLTAAIQ